MRRQLFLYLILLLFFAGATSCESVRPYQRIYLNDRDMKMGQLGAQRHEENVQAYREGATGGGSMKNSGGCGCN
jgi:hypothetical protein